MRTTHIRRIVPVLVLLLAAPCFGWGQDGHKIVSEIATERLTPEAKAETKALLGDQSLVDVCTWADEIKSDPAYRWASTLHYSNVIPGDDGFDLERHCPEQGCVVSAIIKYTKVLGDREASTAEQTAEWAMVSQMRRSAVSAPANVAEGCCRGGDTDVRSICPDRDGLGERVENTTSFWRETSDS